MHDLVIRGGTLVDGTGAPGRTADVAIPTAASSRWAASTARPGGRSTPTASSSPRASSTSTPTTTARPPGTRTSRPRAGTASPPRSSATAASGSPRCAPDRREWLIELMEGVEDIPGSALAEGIRWDWETFPEYLDALDAHAPRARHRHAGAARSRAGLRHGRPRAHEPATADDLAAMTQHPPRRAAGRSPRLLDRTHGRPPRRARRARARHLRGRRRAGRAAGADGRGRAPACSSSCRPASPGRSAAMPRTPWRTSSRGSLALRPGPRPSDHVPGHGARRRPRPLADLVRRRARAANARGADIHPQVGQPVLRHADGPAVAR